MCILFLEICDNPSPDSFRLVVASNRDEHYRRPTDYAHPWKEKTSIIGGRDMEPGREGGTWLAVDTEGYGRMAALLNVMGEPSHADSKPRGALVADYVLGNDHAKDYVDCLSKIGPEYSSFHLVTIDLNPSTGGLWHYSNCSPTDGVGSNVTHFRGGRLSLGNSLVQQPFKKVTAGGDRFDAILQKYGQRAHRDHLVEELVGLLKWNQPHFPDERLENRAEKGNIPKDKLPMFSSVFQRHQTYGTRTHTVILVDADWRCDFYEWTLGENRGCVDPDTSRWNYTHKTFQLAGQ